MKSYFVSGVEGDTVTLTSVLENIRYVYSTTRKTLSSDIASCDIIEVDYNDLKELSKSFKIFGYNAVTDKVVVSSIEDVYNQVSAKLKLFGMIADDVNLYCMQSDYSEDFQVITADTTTTFDINGNGELTVTITLPSCLDGVVSELFINYREVFAETLSLIKSGRVESISNLVFDFKCAPHVAVSDIQLGEANPDLEYLEQINAIRVDKVSFTDRFDMSDATDIFKMFNPFEEPVNAKFNNAKKVFDTRNTTLDLSRFSADNLKCFDYMFSLWDGEVYLPKLNGKVTSKGMFARKNVSPNEIKAFLKNVKPHIIKGSRECFIDCTFIGITPEELEQIKEHTVGCDAYVLENNSLEHIMI